jgi:hypothetical protein
MHKHSLEAYASIKLRPAEKKLIELMLSFGKPACQSELSSFLMTTPRFAAMEDGARVKHAQSMYGRISDLKKNGLIIVDSVKPDPYTGNTCEVYAVNPAPPSERVKVKRAISMKLLLERLDSLQSMFESYGHSRC